MGKSKFDPSWTRHNSDGTFSCNISGCVLGRHWKSKQSVNTHIVNFHGNEIDFEREEGSQKRLRLHPAFEERIEERSSRCGQEVVQEVVQRWSKIWQKRWMARNDFEREILRKGSSPCGTRHWRPLNQFVDSRKRKCGSSGYHFSIKSPTPSSIFFSRKKITQKWLYFVVRTWRRSPITWRRSLQLVKGSCSNQGMRYITFWSLIHFFYEKVLEPNQELAIHWDGFKEFRSKGGTIGLITFLSFFLNFDFEFEFEFELIN